MVELRESSTKQKEALEVLTVRLNDLKAKFLAKEPEDSAAGNLSKPTPVWINKLVATSEVNEWIQTKLLAFIKGAQWRGEVKTLVRNMQEAYEVKTTNISAATKTVIAKWGRDLVEKEIDEICRANADIMAAALAPEISVPNAAPGVENPENVAMTEATKKVLPLLQTQINELSNKMENLEGGDQRIQTVNWAMEVLILMAIFGNNEGQNSTKQLKSLVKNWGFLNSKRREEMNATTQNLVDFQSGKGK